VNRRRFKEREVLDTLYYSGVPVPCYRCKKPMLPGQKVQREHITEIALGGKDEPRNCAYSHAECHRIITDGTPATSAGSSKQRIAKVRRIRGENKPKPKRKWGKQKMGRSRPGNVKHLDKL
jgi:hypothetical protein